MACELQSIVQELFCDVKTNFSILYASEKRNEKVKGWFYHRNLNRKFCFCFDSDVYVEMHK